jgi:hypothetical protein
MDNIFDGKDKFAKLNPTVVKLVDLAEKYDTVTIGAVSNNISIEDVAIIMANRLGEIINLSTNNKLQLYDICNDMITRRFRI